MSGGLILAAPRSGSGKTLLTLALLRHLARSGERIVSAKAGPDYIDPGFHAAASGRPCLNLDAWGMRRPTIAALATALESRGTVICEGVMGLFDGAGMAAEGSTADLAALTGWPVLLIVDAAGQGASVAALVRGFVSHRQDFAIAGLVLNRVAGARHQAILEAALRQAFPELPIIGALPRDDALSLPSRHLGLVPAAEIDHLPRLFDRAADRIASAIDIPALLRLARPHRLDRGENTPLFFPPPGQRIATARDTAFCFAYPALLEGWRKAGAELSFFSPLADEPPDAAADAVYLPGGYPELHAGRLAGNRRFLEGLRQGAAAGQVIYGECGGYMVLGETLVDESGRGHAMAGLLPLVTSFAERRLHLGYRRLRLAPELPFGPAGSLFTAHEFHYARILTERGAASFGRARDADGMDLGPVGLRQGKVCGSFLHLLDRLHQIDRLHLIDRFHQIDRGAEE